MNLPPNVFLDTSVIFAAVFSPQGGARMVLRLGESGLVRLWIGQQVLRECESVVRRKAAPSLPYLALLLDAAKLQIGPQAGEAALERAKLVVSYLPDVPVLAEAIEARPDWFLTHDRQHFLSVSTDIVSFRIGTPGDFLVWFKGTLSQVK